VELKQVEGLVDNNAIWILSNENVMTGNLLLTVSSAAGPRTKLINSSGIFDVKSKDFVQAPRERVLSKDQRRNKKILDGFRYLGVAFSIVLLTFSMLSFMGLVKARIVLTNSMLPSITAGDIVLLANPDRLQPEIGSVVSYTAKRYDGSPVGVFTHRIIGGDAEEGFIVKGDSNPSPDNQRPKGEDVSGVVFFVVPFLGKLLSIKSLIFIIPGVLGVWMILDAIRDED